MGIIGQVISFLHSHKSLAEGGDMWITCVQLLPQVWLYPPLNCQSPLSTSYSQLSTWACALVWITHQNSVKVEGWKSVTEQ